MRLTLHGATAILCLVLSAGCNSDGESASPNGDASAGGTTSSGGSSGSSGATPSGGTTSNGGASGRSNGGNAGARATGGASNGGNSAGGATQGNGGDAGSGNGGAAGSDGGTLPGWTLVWSDEFDGPANQRPDSSKWVSETGGNGWGNNELEYYADRAENAALDGNGVLVITARSESFMGRNYTSARLKTQGKFEHRYGRFEARLRIPKGQGIWPAFWMLGNDIGSVSWPTCGEIDIMENIGREPTLVHGTIHGPGYSGGNGIGDPYSLPGNAPFADDYHVYAIEWETTEIRWYVDGNLFATRTPAELPGGARWVYDHPFFIIMNVAVGGQWPGNPDGTTQFPQEMRVDYVRVYDKV
jgi:beta-glucanase (GH16 family)